MPNYIDSNDRSTLSRWENIYNQVTAENYERFYTQFGTGLYPELRIFAAIYANHGCRSYMENDSVPDVCYSALRAPMPTTNDIRTWARLILAEGLDGGTSTVRIPRGRTSVERACRAALGPSEPGITDTWTQPLTYAEAPPVHRFCEDGCGQEVPEGRRFVRGHHWAVQRDLKAQAKRGNLSAVARLEEMGVKVLRSGEATNYGVEAEYFGITRDASIGALQALGYDAQDDGYHHSVREFWRVTSDGSVNASGTGDYGDGSGNELVSPILSTGRKASKDLSIIGKALREEGGEVDRSCGLHVHHCAAGYTPEQVARTIETYRVFQPLLDSLMPTSRKTENNPAWCKVNESAHAVALRQATSFTDLVRAASRIDRYFAVNPYALQTHLTLEFRQHSGTLNGRKINNWVSLTNLFMQVGKRHNIFTDCAEYGGVDEFMESQTLESMFTYLGAGDRLKGFYKERALALAGVGRADAEDRDANSGTIDEYNQQAYSEPETEPEDDCCHCGDAYLSECHQRSECT